MRFRGAIDTPDAHYITGWAVDETGEPCTLQLVINGAHYPLECEGERPDVAQAGLSNGQGGFRFDPSDKLIAGENRLELHFPDGSHVPGSPFSRTQDVEQLRAAERLSARQPSSSYQGHVDYLGAEALRGWAVNSERKPCLVHVKRPGMVPVVIRTDRPRPDLVDAGFSNGLGGFKLGFADAVDAAVVEVMFADGTLLPGLPSSIPSEAEHELAATAIDRYVENAPVSPEKKQTVTNIAQIRKPGRKKLAGRIDTAPTTRLSLAELDEISLDDLSLAVASGMIAVSPQKSEPQAEEQQDAPVAPSLNPAEAPPPPAGWREMLRSRLRGFLGK